MIASLFAAILKLKMSNLLYTCCITPKCVMMGGGARLLGLQGRRQGGPGLPNGQTCLAPPLN